jgi:hypothetical protein
MRLGQLARKISIHPSEIVAFLAKQNITIEDGNNSRISDDNVRLIFERFAPEQLVSATGAVSENSEIVDVIPEPITEVTPPVHVEEPVAVEEALMEVKTATDESQEESLPDTIKAPKVELKGLTVLGKIELPLPKKKEEEIDEVQGPEAPEPAVVSAASPAVTPRRKPATRDNIRNERPRKNPIALQREREAREAEERKKEEAVRLKEQRTQYYQNRVKPSVPTKAVRIVDEPLHHSTEAIPREKPKTLFGKLLRWLTT